MSNYFYLNLFLYIKNKLIFTFKNIDIICLCCDLASAMSDILN